jgi:hypothetical protein
MFWQAKICGRLAVLAAQENMRAISCWQAQKICGRLAVWQAKKICGD